MKTRSYELIEIIAPANTGQKLMFPDVPQLKAMAGRDVIVEGLEVFGVQAVSVSPLGNPVISIADMRRAFLVLVLNNQEKVKNFPLVSLNRIVPDTTTAANFTPAVVEINEMELKNPEWTKCYVQFAVAPAVTAFSILLGVHYRIQ